MRIKHLPRKKHFDRDGYVKYESPLQALFTMAAAHSRPLELFPE